MQEFEKFEVIYIPEEQNVKVDVLSKLASTKSRGNNRTLIQEMMGKPSFSDLGPRAQAEHNASWMSLIFGYLEWENLPLDMSEAKKLIKEAQHYIVGEHLYNRGFSQVLLKCLGPTQILYVMEKVQ